MDDILSPPLSVLCDGPGGRSVRLSVSPGLAPPPNCSAYLANMQTILTNALHLADSLTGTR